jgi:hypothetical protein
MPTVLPEAQYNTLGHDCTHESAHTSCCDQQAQEDGWRAYLTDHIQRIYCPDKVPEQVEDACTSCQGAQKRILYY